MGKAKHQRPKAKANKPSKQNKNKKHGGNQKDVTELRVQLDVLGLKIIQVTADGNCFFRALADQLEGDEDQHEKYRTMVVQFIKDNREMFEPFVEDDIPFDEYCKTMGEDSTWAGHMELQAASLVTHSNICIHRHLSPRWYIQNFDKVEARMIHLSYHDGEHYNSVRSKQDTCSGPARPINIEGDAEISPKKAQSRVATRSREKGGGSVIHEESVNSVKSASGCEDKCQVEQALQKAGGDIDAAIEVLVAERGLSDQIGADEHSDSVKSSNDVDSEHHGSKTEDKNLKHAGLSSKDSEKTCKNQRLQHDEKKLSRNKACPCGSRKKYKSCCGSGAEKKPSVRIPVNQTVDYGKSRKEKQARKTGSTVANTIQSQGGPPDMGALCI